ncbi:MAG: phosphate/phosphite/phosphonate ABC transporter substrate-binding protein [Desulfobacterales bacterium]|nr:phosphate/phosphite/phosphonate ABC transporter substrate-binding protein [Desulfobacterales bacterium]
MDLFVDILGDIDNNIEVDFLGSTRNLHIKQTSLPAEDIPIKNFHGQIELAEELIMESETNKKGVRLALLCILFLVAVVFLLTTSTAQAGRSLQKYHFGIPPYQKGQTVDEIRGLYKPMLSWLGEQVGCYFDFIGADSYEDMIDMVASGRVQVAGLGPVPYIEAKKKNPGLRLLLTELKWNRDKSRLVDVYHGYIVALKTRDDLNGLLDLKGKSFSFVDIHSTSGYQYPNALMREQGIIPARFFGKVYFLGSHPRVTDAIVAGSIDAGATWDFNLEQAIRKHGDVFKIIYAPPPIPNLAIVAHPSLPLDIQQKIQEVLPTIDPALLQGLPADGFAVRPDSFYDTVRVIVEQAAGEQD